MIWWKNDCISDLFENTVQEFYRDERCLCTKKHCGLDVIGTGELI